MPTTEFPLSQFTRTETSNKVFFVADASDLGLPPGHWPLAITITDVGRFELVPGGRFNSEGELQSMKYLQPVSGSKIIVFND